MRRLMMLAALCMLATACSEASAAKPSASRLVPIVVASQDLPVGSVLTFDNISQRSMPEELVTSSLVQPDSSSYIVNQKLLVPVLANDPIRWSFVETLNGDIFEACEKGQDDGTSAEQQVARARQLVLSHGR